MVTATLAAGGLWGLSLRHPPWP
ncbi:hypothetical protein [Stigmatella hybrida]